MTTGIHADGPSSSRVDPSVRGRTCTPEPAVAAKVLVVVASRHGGTWEIGEWLRDALSAGGHAATLARPAPSVDPTEVDAVVLGSATYSRRWLGEARAWVAHYREPLARRPVWAFDCGMAARSEADDVPSGDAARAGALLGLCGFRHFGGRLDRAVLSRSERAVVGALRAPDVDARQRPDVEAWARDISAGLRVSTPREP